MKISPLHFFPLPLPFLLILFLLVGFLIFWFKSGFLSMLTRRWVFIGAMFLPCCFFRF